ncbi:MAG: 50S ribosomal protein L22 [Candidatus Micrarchaeota archaeon]
MYSYVIEKGKEGDFARARVEGADVSVKDLVEVCGSIRRRPAGQALRFLEEAAEGRRPVLFRSSNKRLGHRRELGGKKGRYPRKPARILLGALRSALANAQQKGLSEELVVAHVCANKKLSYMRYSPKGRRNVSKLVTARVEIVLKEKEGAKRPKKEAAKAPAKGEKPEAPKEALKKEEAKKEQEALKAEVKAEDAELEEKREEKAARHPREEKSLPGRGAPQQQRK